MLNIELIYWKLSWDIYIFTYFICSHMIVFFLTCGFEFPHLESNHNSWNLVKFASVLWLFRTHFSYISTYDSLFSHVKFNISMWKYNNFHLWSQHFLMWKAYIQNLRVGKLSHNAPDSVWTQLYLSLIYFPLHIWQGTACRATEGLEGFSISSINYGCLWETDKARMNEMNLICCRLMEKNTVY